MQTFACEQHVCLKPLHGSPVYPNHAAFYDYTLNHMVDTPTFSGIVVSTTFATFDVAYTLNSVFVHSDVRMASQCCDMSSDSGRNLQNHGKIACSLL